MAKKLEVSPAQLTELAKGIAEDFGAFHTSGSLAVAACDRVQNLYGGKPVSEAHADFLADEIARIRQWTDKSVRVRKQEVFAILAAYTKVPEAVRALAKAWSEAGKSVRFDHALGMARAIKKGKSVTEAVAAYATPVEPTKPEDRTLEQALKSVKTHLKRVLAHKALPREFRTELRDITEKYLNLAV